MAHIVFRIKSSKNNKKKSSQAVKKAAKKQDFYVVMLSTNGRTLNHSENFRTRIGAWINVHATIRTMKIKSIPVLVQDDSLVTPKVYQVSGNKVSETSIKPKK